MKQPENISILIGPDFASPWLTITEPRVSGAALKRCGAVFSKVPLFAFFFFLINYEFGAKLHPTVYLRKIKCQKSCFGPVKSVQKNWAQRAYCILFFPLCPSSSNICELEKLCSADSEVDAVCCNAFPGAAAGSTPICWTHLGLLRCQAALTSNASWLLQGVRGQHAVHPLPW